MGLLSVLGKIGAGVAAPFTGGASLAAIPAIDAIGGVLGKQQGGAAQGRAMEAQAGQTQDRNAIDLYGTQQGAQDRAAQLDLQRKNYETSSRSQAGKQALLAMLLGNHTPSQVSVPGIKSATISGGMGESIRNNPQMLELLKSIAERQRGIESTPMSFTGGELVKAPTLTPLPQQGKGSKILDSIARIAQIGGAVGSALPKRGSAGDNNYGGD